MKKAIILALFTALVGCGDDSTTPTTTEDSGTGKPTVDVSAPITSDTTWTSDNVYVLTGQVFVENATLTIKPGTTIKGDGGDNALIITTTGKINAKGTKESPIVFTSAKAEGSRQRGDWGGIVLLGNAKINSVGDSNNIEGLAPGENRGTYGGNDDTHDCGVMEYVRIEFAGFVFGADNELNGLTVGGCGDETQLDYIQIHMGKDDGIEFFGGKPNLSHAIVTDVGDDSLDWDQGFSGNVQFFIAQQSNNGDKTVEADNSKDMPGAEPRSKPNFWNATLIGGSAEQAAMRLRVGTAGNIGNIVATNFSQKGCVKVDGQDSVDLAISGDLSIQSSIFHGCKDDNVFEFAGDDENIDYAAQVNWSVNTMDPMLEDPTNLTAPNFAPKTGSPVGTDAKAPSAPLDTTANYMGAIDPNGSDWTVGWTAFPEF